MLQDYWWAIFIGLAILAVLILWLILGRRRGVGSEAAASLRDLDGTRAAQPTFARSDPKVADPMTRDPIAPPPAAPSETLATHLGPAPIEHTRTDDDALTSAVDGAGAAGPSAAAEAAAMDDVGSASPAPSSGDDLLRMKGLGPKLRDRLAELGITRFHQIAGWDEADIDRIDEQLGTFRGRIRRDQWVEQARFLAAGDTDGYQAAFGALR